MHVCESGWRFMSPWDNGCAERSRALVLTYTGTQPCSATSAAALGVPLALQRKAPPHVRNLGSASKLSCTEKTGKIVTILAVTWRYVSSSGFYPWGHSHRYVIMWIAVLCTWMHGFRSLYLSWPRCFVIFGPRRKISTQLETLPPWHFLAHTTQLLTPSLNK